MAAELALEQAAIDVATGGPPGGEPVELLTIAGTRPEVLKLAPVIRAIQLRRGTLANRTALSGQHLELVETVLGDLDFHPDIDLRNPLETRTLSESVAWLLKRLDLAAAHLDPDGVIVQGDTNTAVAGAMVAFHRGLPCFHVEAGLRTSNPFSPFPEEMNRRLIGQIASLHFAPTELARDNLLAQGIPPETVIVTGNTVVDTLQIYTSRHSAEAEALLKHTPPGAKRILVTLHRRENAAHALEVTRAIKQLIAGRDDVHVMWLLHLNSIRQDVIRELDGHPGVTLIEPQAYSTFVHLMKAAYLILSDSGGVQEEAPSLGKPVLVLRNETERPEAINAGGARIVGCDGARILAAARELLDDPIAYRRMSVVRSPFGDGHAGERIVDALEAFYSRQRREPLRLMR